MIDNILVLSHHRKAVWQRCHLLHYFKYELKYKKPNWKVEFLFGQAIHRALELYYTDKNIILEDLIQYFYDKIKEEITDENLLMEIGSLNHLGSQLLTIYYKATVDSENFKVVAIEEPYLILVGWNGGLRLLDNLDQVPNTEGDRFFVMSGKIDMIIEDSDGNYLIWDNKTTSMEEDTFISMMIDDEQLLDYSVYGKLKYGDKFGGVVVNGLNKHIKPKPIFRHYFHYSDEELEYAKQNYIQVALEQYIFNSDEKFHSLLQLRNQQFDCVKCEFYDPSMLKRKDRDYQQILDMFYEKYETFDWESHE